MFWFSYKFLLLVISCIEPQWDVLIRSFGNILSPDHLRREVPEPVSCYAIFNRWLLLSQLPGCLRNFTSFIALSIYLGTLTGGLGCFPFDQRSLAPAVWLPSSWLLGIRSLIGQMSLRPDFDHPVLYPRQEQMRLVLKLFRREPAITRLD